MTIPWPMPNSAPSFKLVWKPKTSFHIHQTGFSPGIPSRSNIQLFDARSAAQPPTASEKKRTQRLNGTALMGFSYSHI